MGGWEERKSGICWRQTCGPSLSPEALVGGKTGNLRDVNVLELLEQYVLPALSPSTPATHQSPNIHKVSQKIHTYTAQRYTYSGAIIIMVHHPLMGEGESLSNMYEPPQTREWKLLLPHQLGQTHFQCQ